jgi:hypothetical protein
LQATSSIQWLIWVGIAALGGISVPLATALWLMVVLGTFHAAGRAWLGRIKPTARLPSRYAAPPGEAARFWARKEQDAAAKEEARRQREMTPLSRDENDHDSDAFPGEGRGARHFTGLIYIGQDGVEREAPDLPTLAAHIRDGDIAGSTLLRRAPDEPWRRAEADPSVAALLALAASNRASGRASQRAVDLTGRVGAIALKTMFLFVMFVIAAVTAAVVGQLNSDALMSLLGVKIGSRLSFPTLIAVFVPAILAVRDRRFTLGGKAKRFSLSLLVAAAAVNVPGFVAGLLLNILPPLGPWSTIGLLLCAGIGGWVLLAYGLKRIWLMPNVLGVLHPIRSYPGRGVLPSTAIGTPSADGHSSVGDDHDVARNISSDEAWRTFLDHDEAVREAVERLAALSAENVSEFQRLLVAGRDRARVKEYEDASVRRIQGPAFVGDRALQKAYAVLNSRDRRLGDELVRVTRVIGRPDDLKRVVTQILSNSGKWLTLEEPFEVFWRHTQIAGSMVTPKNLPGKSSRWR